MMFLRMFLLGEPAGRRAAEDRVDDQPGGEPRSENVPFKRA